MAIWRAKPRQPPVPPILLGLGRDSIASGSGGSQAGASCHLACSAPSGASDKVSRRGAAPRHVFVALPTRETSAEILGLTLGSIVERSLDKVVVETDS